MTSVSFDELTTPFRNELLTHCYRMTGSFHDAEDLVQETYLRAWRAFDRFEGRSSLRTWMYRIATTVCLTALQRRSRRSLPSGLGPPSDDPEHPLATDRNRAWLQPAPNSMLAATADPADTAALQESIRLAFIAVLQHPSPLQRAVLLLCDVLQWRPAEVAALLETTASAVYSALRRARATVTASGIDGDRIDQTDQRTQQTLADYLDAFTRADIARMTELLHQDVRLEMPPTLTWFRGRAAVLGFLNYRFGLKDGRWRALPCTANGQPAAALYLRASPDEFRALLQAALESVLTPDGELTYPADARPATPPDEGETAPELPLAVQLEGIARAGLARLHHDRDYNRILIRDLRAVPKLLAGVSGLS